MPRKISLTQAQERVLGRAAERDTRLIYPIPDRVGDSDAMVTRILAPLRKQGLVVEGVTGLFVSEKGIAALDAHRELAKEVSSVPAIDASERRPNPSKRRQVMSMLERSEGASIQELSDAMDWLPHSTRAALTGLRKKGISLQSEKVGGIRRYRSLGGGVES